MNISIETNTTQQLTSEQVDSLACSLCGVRRSLSDPLAGAYNTATISLDGISAQTSTCYRDSAEALLTRGITIAVDTYYQRVLDPAIKSVLLNTFQHSDSNAFTAQEFSNITTFPSTLFKNNKNITEFLELPYTGVTALPASCFNNSSIKKLDLTGITQIGEEALGYIEYELKNATSFFNNITSIDRRAFCGSTITNVQRITCQSLTSITGWSHDYGAAAFPEGLEFLYLPECTTISGHVIPTMSNGLVYFPKLQTWVRDDPYIGPSPLVGKNKLISIGEPYTTLSKFNIVFLGSNEYISGAFDSCIIFHSGQLEFSTYGWSSFVTQQYANKAVMFIPSTSRQTLFSNASSDEKMCYQSAKLNIETIGFQKWKETMQACAGLHEYTLPDEYTDWSYDYIDYLIGEIPLPSTQLDSPTTIQISDPINILSNNDDISSTTDEIELHAIVNSYKNVCTYELLENNAGVTLTGNVISVPSTANGETVTIKATSTYNTNVYASVTVKVYSNANVSTNKCNAKTQQILLQYYYPNKRYLTDSDITAITILPGRIFKNETGLGNANWLKYTNVVRGSSIPQYSDLDCFAGSDITSVSFPDTIDNIPRGCCADCPNLTIMEFPQTSFSIPYNWTFSSCQALTTVENLSNVVYIADNSFYQCYNLEYFGGAGSTAGELNLPNLTHLGELSFYCCRKLKTIVDLGNITRIKGGAFQGCTELLSIVIPDSVTVVEASAFTGCGKLTTVSLPEGLDEINAYAFQTCSALTRLTIPSTVTKLSGNYGLVDRCNNLQELVFLGTTPPTINQSGLLYGTPNTCKIYVPDSSISAYETAIGVKNSGLISRITPLSQLPT